jgi:hypothetical protein
MLAVTRVDALRREAEEEVAPHDETGRLKRGEDDLPRRARIRGALEDDELPDAKPESDGFHGAHDVREIRALGLAERCGHADEDGVHASQEVEILGGGQAPGLYRAREILVSNVDQVGTTGHDGLDPHRIDIEAGDLEPGPGQLEGFREPYVAEPDDTNLSRG